MERKNIYKIQELKGLKSEFKSLRFLFHQNDLKKLI